MTLPNTLVAPDVSLSLQSVPSLVHKGLAVLFVPERAFLINMNDGNKVLGTAYQDPDGRFYIGDDVSSSDNQDDGSDTAQTMVAVTEPYVPVSDLTNSPS